MQLITKAMITQFRATPEGFRHSSQDASKIQLSSVSVLTIKSPEQMLAHMKQADDHFPTSDNKYSNHLSRRPMYAKFITTLKKEF